MRVTVRVTGSGNESDVLLLGGRPTAPPGAAPLFKEEHRRLLSARPEGREQPRDPEHQEGPQGADHLLDQVGELLGQVDQPVDFEHGPAGALPAVQREGGELAAEVLHGIPTDAATREKVSAVSTLQMYTELLLCLHCPPGTGSQCLETFTGCTSKSCLNFS